MKITIRTMLLAVCLVSQGLRAQTVTLEECIERARTNYPSVRRYSLIEQSRDYTLDNAAKGWLPQVSVSAGGYAFTDIVDMDGRIGKMGLGMKNSVASGSVTVSQPVYDGGQIAAQKNVTRAQAEVERSGQDVSLYDVNRQVEELFFSILLLDGQLEQNALLQKNLGDSRSFMQSRIKNGMANSSDMDLIDVELMKAGQQREQLSASRKAFVRMLALFIGKDIDSGLDLVRPQPTALPAWSESGVERPEMEYFAAQSRLVDMRKKQLNVRLRPTIQLFATGLLHSQVTDAVNDAMVFGGISLKWNIGALYTRRNDLHNLEIQRQDIDTRRDTFLFGNRLQYEQTGGSIDALRRQISLDEKIIELRDNIQKQSERKVELGTESTNELLRDINSASEARVQKVLHETQLIKEIYLLKFIGNYK